MLTELIRKHMPGPPGNRPEVPSEPRQRLRAAIDAAGQAAEGAQRAAGAAERGRAAVAKAEAAAGHFAPLDGLVAAERAARLRDGQEPAELPPDLARARIEQAAAERELIDARHADELLEREAQQAAVAADAARAAVGQAVAAIMAADAQGLVAELRQVEARAARLRLLIGSLPLARTPADPPLDWGIGAVRHDPQHAVMLALLPADPPGATAADVWTRYRKALLADPAAELPALK